VPVAEVGAGGLASNLLGPRSVYRLGRVQFNCERLRGCVCVCVSVCVCVCVRVIWCNGRWVLVSIKVGMACRLHCPPVSLLWRHMPANPLACFVCPSCSVLCPGDG
jgi:hypothetical protein